jgi:PqqD family protein of HPr-rel-A system
MQWRIIDDKALQLRFWDGECVVYNALSGDLHVLDERAAYILQTLQQAPADVLSLAQRFASEWQCEPSDDLLHEIEMTVSDMHALALVERD